MLKEALFKFTFIMNNKTYTHFVHQTSDKRVSVEDRRKKKGVLSGIYKSAVFWKLTGRWVSFSLSFVRGSYGGFVQICHRKWTFKKEAPQ